MKKFSSYLASALLMSVVFTSCSSGPEDINVADLKEPCEFADAAVQCMEAIFDIVEGANSPDNFSEGNKKRLRNLGWKMRELIETGEKRFDDAVEDCLDKEQKEQIREKLEPYLEILSPYLNFQEGYNSKQRRM